MTRKNAGVGREIRAHLFFADGMAGPPTIEDGIVGIDRRKADLFPLFCGWLSFHRAFNSRIKPLLEMRFEALEHLFLMSLMSVNRSYLVTSQFLRAPSTSKMNSSTSPRWSRYFSRRCCLQMSAVCFCRFLVPNPIFCTES